MVLNLGPNSEFFWGAIIFIIAHFVSYYKLLDSISINIEQKKRDTMSKLTAKFKKAPKDNFIEIHAEIHKQQNIFRNLNQKKLQIFYFGLGIFILLLAGWAVGFFPDFSDALVMIIMFVVSSGFLILIDFSTLLRWNLNNPRSQ